MWDIESWYACVFKAQSNRVLSGVLLCLDFLLFAEGSRSEDGVLARHASAKGAVKFGSQRQLAHVVCLLIAHSVSLLDQTFVLETVKACVPRFDVLRLGIAGG